jgi:hypothetical protein
MESRISKDPVVNGLAAIVCFVLGWYWLPFLFVAFAFLFHLITNIESKTNIYQFSFAIFSCVSTSIILIKILEDTFTWLTLIQAFTLPFAFIIFEIIDRKLPKRFSYFIIILFWLSYQYLFIKFAPGQFLFLLPNAPCIPPSWMRWNTYTGFMGGSLWILVVNLFVFQSFFKSKRIDWLQIIFLVAVVMIPIFISQSVRTNALQSNEMLDLYTGRKIDNMEYTSTGELILRTAVWISVLIIIFTFVKAKTIKIR